MCAFWYKYFFATMKKIISENPVLAKNHLLSSDVDGYGIQM